LRGGFRAQREVRRRRCSPLPANPSPLTQPNPSNPPNPRQNPPKNPSKYPKTPN